GSGREPFQGHEMAARLPALVLLCLCHDLPRPENQGSERVKAKKPERQRSLTDTTADSPAGAAAGPAIDKYAALLNALPQFFQRQTWIAWLLVAAPVLISL